MRVLLVQDMENLGRMGEVVEVKGGYARNFLIPKGLAVAVERGRLKEIEERKKALEKKALQQRQEYEAIAERIKASLPLKIKVRCSQTGKLFGSVTNRHIAELMTDLLGEEIDRHKIFLDEKIRSVGTYSARVRLHPDVDFQVELLVECEGFVPEESLEPVEVEAEQLPSETEAVSEKENET
ncbi:MAG: 50S ribosomal protein L9 [Actinomycetota bacterium]|nr:50S ribosomal protein L9 [Actinomycetota bacterium]